MKTNKLFLLTLLAAAITVTSLDSVKDAFLFCNNTAYADPSITYINGTDGNEHVALNNFYPETTYNTPSEWQGNFGLTVPKVQAKLGMSYEALNTCVIVDTHCEEDTDNLCPLCMTGLSVVKPNGQVITVYSNPF